jgi:hypothetical protein
LLNLKKYKSFYWLFLYTIIAGIIGYLNQIGLMQILSINDFRIITFYLVIHFILNLPISAFNQAYINNEYIKNTTVNFIYKIEGLTAISVVTTLILLILGLLLTFNINTQISIIVFILALSTSFLSIDLITKYNIAIDNQFLSGLNNIFMHSSRLISLLIVWLMNLSIESLICIYVIFQLAYVITIKKIYYKRYTIIDFKIKMKEIINNNFIKNLFLMVLVNADIILIYIYDLNILIYSIIYMYFFFQLFNKIMKYEIIIKVFFFNDIII